MSQKWSAVGLQLIIPISTLPADKAQAQTFHSLWMLNAENGIDLHSGNTLPHPGLLTIRLSCL